MSTENNVVLVSLGVTNASTTLAVIVEVAVSYPVSYPVAIVAAEVLWIT